MQLILQNTQLKAIIIELNSSGHRYGVNEMNIHEDMKRLNFQPYAYDPFTRTLNSLVMYGSTNTIYIRDVNFVNIRLQQAEKIHLFSESF